ncbi:MAG: amino acid/amide transporter rane protein 1, family, partial [Acidimicrobiales bacterium]|nr:amino acid/amide transporter rane protein 1, family [Acidimicrobiales bacterium]
MLAVAIAQPAVFGIVNGAAFGLVAIGLVLIYKSSRVFNFAAGEFATLGAFGTYIGIKVLGLPYLPAALLGVATGTVAGLLTERLVVRPLANRPKVTVLVATAAIATILIPLELMIGGVKTFPARPAFTDGVSVGGTKLLSKLGPTFFGVHVSPQLLLIIVALVAIGVGLAWFFGRTDLGLATLATSQEPVAGRLVGIRLNRISMLTWGAAGFLGGLAGVLLAPVTAQFSAGYGTTGVL